MRILLFFIGLFVQVTLFAQSENDLCENAIIINTLETTIGNYDMDQLSFDLTNGSCATEEEAGNYWFRFESHGHYLKFSTLVFGEISQIVLLQFDDTPCDNSNYQEITCGNGLIESVDLIDGEEYYISVSTVPDFEDVMTIIIENPDDSPPPVNDEPCNAVVFTSNECKTSTLFNATYYQQDGNCSNEELINVWYQYKIPPFAIGVKTNINSNEDYGLMQLRSGIHAGDCEDDYFVRSCYLTNEFPLNSYSNELTQINTYSFDFSAQVSVNDSFEICFEPIFPLPNTLPCDADFISYGETAYGNTAFSQKDITLSQVDCPLLSQHTLWYRIDNHLHYPIEVQISFENIDFQSDLFIGFGYFEDNCSSEFIFLEHHCSSSIDSTYRFASDEINDLLYVVIGSEKNIPGEFKFQYNVDFTGNAPINDEPDGAIELVEKMQSKTILATTDIEACGVLNKSVWFTFSAEASDSVTYGVLEYYFSSPPSFASILIGHFPSTIDPDLFVPIHEICDINASDHYIFDLDPTVSKYYVQVSAPHYYENQIQLEFTPQPSNDLPCYATYMGDFDTESIIPFYASTDLSFCNQQEHSLWYYSDIKYTDSTTYGNLIYELPYLYTGDSMSIVVGYFVNDCTTDEFIVLQERCSVDSSDHIVFDVLLGITQYHFIVTSSSSIKNPITLTFSSQPLVDPPSNDLPCDATKIEILIPENITTAYATVDIESCEKELLSSWFYIDQEYSIDFPTATIIFRNAISYFHYSAIQIGYFPDSCSSDIFTSLVEDCDIPISGHITLDLVPGIERYYIQFSSENEYTGQPNLTYHSGPCDTNDSYNNAITLFPTSTSTCISSCNIASESDDLLVSCEREDQGVVWFKFDTDFAFRYNIIVSNASFPSPVLEIFTIDDQGNRISLFDCVRGSLGTANFLFQEYPINETIYISVSNGIGGSGYFDLCIRELQSINNCTISDTLEVISTSMGSSLNGPFLPGETVDYCYTVSNYSNIWTSCQWLHGIIPVFGDCWDSSSFDIKGQPQVSTSIIPYVDQVTWSWYDDVHYNNYNPLLSVGDFDGNGTLDMCHAEEPNCENIGLEQGHIMPPGWYVSRGKDSVGMNNHPKNSWGDGSGCHTIISRDWKVCFSLTSRADSSMTYNNCDVKIFTTSDGETGKWNGNILSGCGDDIPIFRCFSLQCLEGPEIETAQVFELCSGIKTKIDLITDQEYDYISWKSSWESLPQDIRSGNASIFQLSIDNHTDTIQNIPFDITVEDGFGCRSTSVEIILTVFPNINIDLTEIDHVCADKTIDLGGNPTTYSYEGNTYVYEWYPEGIAPISNPFVNIDSSTIFSLSVTDENNCKAFAKKSISLFSDEYKILGDSVICPNNENTQFSINTETASGFVWFLDDEIISNENTINLNIDNNNLGNHIISVVFEDINDCSIQLNLEVTITDLPTFDFPLLSDTLWLCQGYEYDMYIQNQVPNYTYNYSWTTPISTETEDTLTITLEGHYFLQTTNEFGCSFIDSFVLAFFDSNPIQFTGDLDLCIGNEGQLGTVISYEHYDWSNNENSSEIIVEPGDYFLTILDSNNCQQIDSITITSFPENNTQIIGDTLLCKDQYSTLSTTIDYESYLWSTNEVTSSILVGPGSYFLYTEDNNLCSGVDTITINEVVSPTADFVYTKESLNFEFINQSVDGDTYLWDFGDTENSIEINPSHSYSNEGNYDVQLISYLEDCSDTIRQTIEAKIVNIIDYRADIHIYPNPTSSGFYIDFEDINPSSSTLKIRNYLGIVQYNQPIKIYNKRMFVDHKLSSGIYFICIEINGFKILKRVVVM